MKPLSKTIQISLFLNSVFGVLSSCFVKFLGINRNCSFSKLLIFIFLPCR